MRLLKPVHRWPGTDRRDWRRTHLARSARRSASSRRRWSTAATTRTVGIIGPMRMHYSRAISAGRRHDARPSRGCLRDSTSRDPASIVADGAAASTDIATPWLTELMNDQESRRPQAQPARRARPARRAAPRAGRAAGSPAAHGRRVRQLSQARRARASRAVRVCARPMRCSDLLPDHRQPRARAAGAVAAATRRVAQRRRADSSADARAAAQARRHSRSRRSAPTSIRTSTRRSSTRQRRAP